MKTFIALALTFGMLTTAFASENYEVPEAQSNKLVDLLIDNGAFHDCGMGTCGTGALKVSCTKTRTVDDAVCDLVLPADERHLKTKVAGKEADFLVELLSDASAFGCGMQSCGGTSVSISCVYPNSARADGAKCSIDQ